MDPIQPTVRSPPLMSDSASGSTDTLNAIGPGSGGGGNDLALSQSGSTEGLDQHQVNLVRQKEMELKEMQDQIESYNQIVNQLTSQREIAVKKLSDMDTQIAELNKQLEAERLQVEAKDRELKSKRSQIMALKEQDDELKEKLDQCKSELFLTTENLATTKATEAQIQTHINELKHFVTMTNSAIDEIERTIQSKDTIKLSGLCSQTLTPPKPLSTNNLLINGICTSDRATLGGPKSNVQAQAGKGNIDSSCRDGGAFDGGSNFDPFAGEDPFDGEDPFKTEPADLALPEDDPFNPSSSTTSFPRFPGTSLFSS